MKRYYFISLWLIATVVSLLCTACHSNHPQIQAAYDLIERVTPGYGNQFQLELIDSENGKDVYEIGSQNGKVLLRGNNPVALATAYNQGADEGIRQAQAEGLLGPMLKVWRTSGDDAVCDMCAALDGTEIGMDDSFAYAGKLLFPEQRLLPPAHPRCACAVEYIESPVFRYA